MKKTLTTANQEPARTVALVLTKSTTSNANVLRDLLERNVKKT